MKTLCYALLLMLVTSSVFADEYVHGYTRKDGTYVQPYHRSSPDSSYNNNYSTKGNSNPYTSEYGTNSPTFNDRTPSYNRKQYGDDLRDNSGGSYKYKSIYR